MRIEPNEFMDLQMKYPNSEVKINKVLCFEGRYDVLLVHFRNKAYEVFYPTNTIIKKEKITWLQ